MISNFEIYFTEILKKIKNNNYKFILALSGGMDSMALLHLLKNFIKTNKQFKIEVIPIIIDHGLRSVSSKEAIKVKKISETLGFKAQIKKINECRPNGNIQNWARKQRRDILFQISSDLQANLMLAHHFDDQAETIFMRMLKDTAIDGLSGMSEITKWNGVLIIRPLMFCKKKQIRKYINNNKITYFEDESNFDLKFERVKTRLLIELIEKNVWSNISDDINYFSNLNSNLLKKSICIFNSWGEKNISIYKGGAVRIKYKVLKDFLNNSHYFSIRIIGKIIQTVGGSEYPPKRKKTFELLSSLINSKHFHKKCLGNVCVALSRGYLYFIRENRNLNFNINIKKNTCYIFDGRFLVFSAIPGKLVKSNNSYLLSNDHKNPFYEYFSQINNTIPYLKTLEGETIRPHLNIINQNSIFDDSHKNDYFNLYLIDRILV